MLAPPLEVTFPPTVTEVEAIFVAGDVVVTVRAQAKVVA